MLVNPVEPLAETQTPREFLADPRNVHASTVANSGCVGLDAP